MPACLSATLKDTADVTDIAFFYSLIVHIDVSRVSYLPNDAQESCFKRNVKIYIKTAPTCFGLITIIRERII